MAGDVDATAREKLMRALIEGQNNTQAARTSGYSRKHVKELLHQPAFARELERRKAAKKSEPVSDADLAEADRLEALAMETLERVAKEGGQASEVAAAKEIRAKAKELRGHKPTQVSQSTHDQTEVADPAKKESAAESAARYGFKLAK